MKLIRVFPLVAAMVLLTSFQVMAEEETFQGSESDSGMLNITGDSSDGAIFSDQMDQQFEPPTTENRSDQLPEGFTGE